MSATSLKYTVLIVLALLSSTISALLGRAVVNTLAMLFSGQNVSIGYDLENWEIVVTFGSITLILLFASFLLLCAGLRVPGRQILKWARIASIAVVLGFFIFSSYCWFLVFSHNLGDKRIDLQLPAFYSDTYLEEQRFVRRTHLMENSYCLGKTDIFTWQIGGISFTDTLELCLETTYDLKPWYSSYSVEMSPKVDSNFVAMLERNHIKRVHPEITESSIEATASICREYYEVADRFLLEREYPRDRSGTSRTIYRINRKQHEPLLNWLEMIVIKYCHYLNS